MPSFGRIGAADAPVVLAVHSASGFSGYAASDRVPGRIAAMVYVDTAPGKPPLEPDFADVEKPLAWDDVADEENLEGLSEEQLAAFRERAVPVPGAVLREGYEFTSDARLDIPSTIIATGYSAADYQTYAKRAPGVGVPRGDPGAPRHHLDRPADEPLADVVAPGRASQDHR